MLTATAVSNLDVTISRGDSLQFLITVNVNGDPLFPYDLATVSEILFNIKADTNPTNPPLIQKKLSLAQIVISAPTTLGQYTVYLNPADTDLLNTLKSYWIDSSLVDATGSYTVVSATLGGTPKLSV
jgi:hypothetical protein